MSLSIVIPVYNEQETIKDAILECLLVFPGAEIIVVNDASTDRTYNILRKLQRDHKGIRIITNKKNMGHGYSVMRGLKLATRDRILYIDADCQISLWGMPTLNADFISGYRFQRKDKLFRKVISFCLKLTNLLIHGYYIKDANCPYKIYKRESLMNIIGRVPRTYIVPIACIEVIARQYGYSTKTVKKYHHPYYGERKGFLQVLNIKTLTFFTQAFMEVVRL